MESYSLTFLDLTEYKVFKVIEINGSELHPFNAYLPYIRKFIPGIYEHKDTDILDGKILEEIKRYYPKSSIRESLDIVYKGQLEKELRRQNGSTTEKMLMKFLPFINSETAPFLLNKQFTEYSDCLNFGY